MSYDITQEDLDAADGTVEQVLDTCRRAAVDARRDWAENGQDLTLALADIARAVVRALASEYDVEDALDI